MDIAKIPAENIPGKVTIRVPQEELVSLIVRAAHAQDASVQEGRFLDIMFDYKKLPVVVELTIEQPAEADGETGVNDV